MEFKAGLKFSGFTVAILLVLFFQNCGNNSGITATNEGGVATTASVPPEAEPSAGGPPSSGGSGSIDGGGSGDFFALPFCFEFVPSELSSPDKSKRVYVANLYGKTEDGRVIPTRASSAHLYIENSKDGSTEVLENYIDVKFNAAFTYFLIPKRGLPNNTVLTLGAYHKSYCEGGPGQECVQIPLCSGNN